jgi:large subunit ribosomal protein L6|tara:strand:+ start:638 stop:1102 length:465 start_codon:yes stop_codon:yes gene_type:complete
MIKKLKIATKKNLFFKKATLFIRGPLGTNYIQDIKYLRKKPFLCLSLLKNTFHGVFFGYVCRLKLVGLGFRVETFSPNFFTLKLGLSYTVKIGIPKGISVSFPKKGFILISSFDFSRLKSFVAFLRNKKTPDAYKGKGILFKNEIFKLKEGKKN